MFRVAIHQLHKNIAQKLKQRPLLTKILITTATAIALALSSLMMLPAAADGTVSWTGQGVTDGVLNTSQCDAQNTPYLFWVFTAGGGANTVTSATLTLGGSGTGTYPMTEVGNEWRATTPFYSLTTLTASVSYTGNLGSGNANLNISHGCSGGVAKVTLTKTYEQGVFTQATSGACFTLAPALGTSSATQCSNTPEWDGLPVGSYTITETTTPAGYTTIDPISFTVSNNCGMLTNCVQTGNSTAASLGTFEDMLLPGYLQVTKRLGPAPGTTWTGPNVTFYVCANGSNGSDPTELTAAQCNSSTATQTLTATSANPVVESAALAEGYYTVCEAPLSGYTVNDECQVVSVNAGSTAADNPLTFINTPALYWCSPGFWATALSQNRIGVLTYLALHGVNLNTKYSVAQAAVGGASLSKKAPAGDPTIAQVLLAPQTYGGPAFNTVADYIAKVLGWGGSQLTGENCPLDAHGTWTVTL